jgi:hypothetical protein
MKLFKEFAKRKLGGYEWRWTKGEPKQKADLIFRWGNAYQDLDVPKEINTKKSNRNASNKLTMAKLLHSHEDAKFPDVVFDLKDKISDMEMYMLPRIQTS